MSFNSFYDLEVWKKSRLLKLTVYKLIKQFPEQERYELVSQLRRAARSIPANISEGHGRRTNKEQVSFCIIARGSHSELLNHLIDALDCGYISQSELLDLKKQWDEVGRLLNGFIAFLKGQSNSTNQSNATAEDFAVYTCSNSENSEFIFLNVLNSNKVY